ncbi:MAG: sigma-70 family RNA polymerase sigma factor [Myxococcales bacterium]|nr:sigma-70 family RNA polymerase sigma factor [Myxococcales bacterium]MCB9644893.1 sigma-70 family RNA polymerase sigma factor [Myxococcales bacterium]
MKLSQDRELFQGFQQGDAQALATVYLHYAPKLYEFLSRGFTFSSQDRWFRVPPLLDPCEQESYVQETFTRAFSPQARQNYDPTRAYLPYLQRICRNLLIEDRRKQQSHRVEELETLGPSEEIEANEPPIEEQFEETEMRKQIESFLQACDPREALVFRALYEEGDSQMQAAQRLGLSRMQVRTSLQRLRSALLDFFEQSGYLQHLQQRRAEYANHLDTRSPSGGALTPFLVLLLFAAWERW